MENKKRYETEEGERPVGPNGKPMKKFEIRKQNNKKDIYIDGELFDWNVDPSSLQKAAKMGPEYLRAAQSDIQRHFVESISEFVGRDITLRDIAYATTKGWI